VKLACAESSEQIACTFWPGSDLKPLNPVGRNPLVDVTAASFGELMVFPHDGEL